MFDYTRIAEHYWMARNVTIYKTIWGYHYVISDGDIAAYRSIDANIDFIADGWISFALPSIFLTYGCPFMYITIIANDGMSVNSYAKSMAKIQAVAYSRIPINIITSS